LNLIKFKNKMARPQYSDRYTGDCPYIGSDPIVCAFPGCRNAKCLGYCYVTELGAHINFCQVHREMDYIYCQKCYKVHPYLKLCHKNYKKLMRRVKKLEEKIRYLPGGVPYAEAQAEFQTIQAAIN
jgi:hypothetical protein